VFWVPKVPDEDLFLGYGANRIGGTGYSMGAVEGPKQRCRGKMPRISLWLYLTIRAEQYIQASVRICSFGWSTGVSWR
jgi:hypothetical protein